MKSDLGTSAIIRVKLQYVDVEFVIVVTVAGTVFTGNRGSHGCSGPVMDAERSRGTSVHTDVMVLVTCNSSLGHSL